MFYQINLRDFSTKYLFLQP